MLIGSYVSSELQRLVAARATYLCEYCLIHKDDTFFGCELDHIISIKHGGPTDSGNLAYACSFCNRHKGSDIASISPLSNELVRFFNPRTDRWSDHFRLNGFVVEPLTSIAEATTRILRINDPERILEREALSTAGRFPTAAARERIQQ